MTVELYLAFILTGFLVIASPGPTSFLVLAHAMGTDRRSPAFAIAGILCSNTVFVTVTVLGLTTALSASQPALVFIRTLGAVYLIYLGGKHIVTAFRAEKLGGTVSPVSHAHGRTAFFQGFLTSITNPKALLFYFSLFSQFVTPGMDVVRQQIILGITYIFLVLVVLTGYTILGHRVALFFQQAKRWPQCLSGGCLIATGAFMAKTARG